MPINIMRSERKARNGMIFNDVPLMCIELMDLVKFGIADWVITHTE